ncbi:unnamed protein product [Darwinula stevensoni]|uniref:Uncharacterized protein n=2 Tax=Darwinula stevensoni TaxID=69355 RepID=A0A7R9AJP5_9CRUS|nr:unnamed protein product [Darwinula stevensoni]CAG0908722.1 unnamed protein product [Darwinula stevensoni]
MAFTGKTIVERTEVATRTSVKEQGGHVCHAYVRGDRLAGVVISDDEYPQRVAHTLIMKVLDDFATQVNPSMWPTGDPTTVNFPGLEVTLARYQNPKEADAMSKIQSELDETKIILHNTLEAVLQRGEKLDDLVARSEGLSVQSKMFFKTARKTNQCCTYF